MLSSERDLTSVHSLRRGFSLPELVFVLALGALVLGLVSSVGVRLQRRMLGEAARFASNDQLSAAAELFPLDVRGLSPPAGDITMARDTAFQIRAPVWNGVACSSAGNSLTVAAYVGAAGHRVMPAVQSGDTLWSLVDADTAEGWRPLRVESLRQISGTCPAIDASGTPVFDLSHLWSVALRDSASVPNGAPVRLTRPLRLSIYRSGDGRWYLGMRSWSTATAQWNIVQPLAGPFASASRGGARLQYFDFLGHSLALGSPDLKSIARVEALFVADSVTPGGTAAGDSQRVVVALRNR
jgi:prepilin-type N-terminal cleavage/methylation domain-containing protein